MRQAVYKIADALSSGKVVIFPTDTAFGIGARIDDGEAVRRVFNIKGRGMTKAVPVLVSDVQMAKRYVRVNPEVERMMDTYWPGGLTLVLPLISKNISPLVHTNNSLAVRMPHKKEVLEIINMIGVPIVGTSANFSGDKTPFTFEELNPKLVQQVDFVLKGRCNLGKPSTILDATANPWRIVRQGAVEVKISK